MEMLNQSRREFVRQSFPDSSHTESIFHEKSDSPYKGGTFNFNLSLPQNYPFKAPTVSYISRLPSGPVLAAHFLVALAARWPSLRRFIILELMKKALSACPFSETRCVFHLFNGSIFNASTKSNYHQSVEASCHAIDRCVLFAYWPYLKLFWQ